jgi:hypothetical protein
MLDDYDRVALSLAEGDITKLEAVWTIKVEKVYEFLYEKRVKTLNKNLQTLAELERLDD